jgi:hypothetical protein
MVPVEALVLPQFLEFRAIGLLGTYWAVILPSVALPVALLVFHSFIKAIPVALIEAARLDGASWWRIYSRIAMPLSRPAISAVAILTFITSWNAFLWPLLVLRPSRRPSRSGSAAWSAVPRSSTPRPWPPPSSASCPCSRSSWSSSARSPRGSRTPASSSRSDSRRASARPAGWRPPASAAGPARGRRRAPGVGSSCRPGPAGPAGRRPALRRPAHLPRPARALPDGVAVARLSPAGARAAHGAAPSPEG